MNKNNKNQAKKASAVVQKRGGTASNQGAGKTAPIITPAGDPVIADPVGDQKGAEEVIIAGPEADKTAPVITPSPGEEKVTDTTVTPLPGKRNAGTKTLPDNDVNPGSAVTPTPPIIKNKSALEIAKRFKVKYVFENTKGEFFTASNLAVLSEGGNEDKVITHDFSAIVWE